jgi:adenylosuccinate synthase
MVSITSRCINETFRISDDTRERIALAQIEQKRILFEGAQGVMLDIFQDHNPTTSSECTHGAVGATFGVYDSVAVIGVAEARRALGQSV